MRRERSVNSIAEQVRMSSRLLTAVLVLPAVIGIAVMLVYAGRYNAIISRMETVVSLKPMVSTDIPEQVWSAVAGTESFTDCGVYATIGRVKFTLEGLIAGRDDQLELLVARRTMDTLTGYVQRIEQNIATGVPVAESEHTLDEVRDVAALVENMLENCISREIEAAAVTNAALSQAAVFATAAEMLLLIAAFMFSRRSSTRLARSIHEPIAQLEHFAGLLADGNLRARVPATDVQELQDLTGRVNVMADKLQTLIAQNRREQENLKKAELRLLQAQINPHFLYNTLDAIVWQAEAGHSDEVIRITRAMSDFFRISLSSGEDWIPISQEMKHLTGYMAIQKIRYRNILNYELDVPEELGRWYVLKLLLQPLVENALYHGIKYKRGGGTITVSGRLEDGQLRFSVRDTGRGMDESQLRAVLAGMRGDDAPPAREQQPAGSGFGLRNVDQRIRLYYNQPEGLRIQSGPDGTCVSFRVPAREKGGNGDV